jgi:hypothetical protein
LPAVTPIRYAHLARKDTAAGMSALARDLAGSLDPLVP